jgi:two-component system sensor histidine kinase KdpD
MARIWFGVAGGTGEHTILDSRPDEPRPRPASHWTLIRAPGDRPAQWIRTHVGDRNPRPARDHARASESLFRVKIEADGITVGSLWATRPANAPAPDREETRLLALAADQLGLAVHRDELAATATAAEVARQSDALKSALLTSVSHDLRTPLAGIRAAAGSLMDPAVAWNEADARETARTIDLEADRLNRLVRNLLDLSRIEAGALRPDLEVLDLDDVLSPVIARVASLFRGRAVEVDVGPEVPPVRADAVYLDEAITNLLENAARYAGEQARVRVTATAAEDNGDPPGRRVRLLVEDSGPGVPVDALPRLFEKFQRRARHGDRSQQGMGIGLSVAKGLVEAMHGSVRAMRSDALGGLAVEVVLPAVDVPPDPA